MPSNTKPKTEEKFAEFFLKWMSILEEYLSLLLAASSNPSPSEDQQHHLQALITKLTAHHKQYYTEKWAAAHGGNVFLFFSPPWMTPLENAYSWMTGWKPSMAFKLVDVLRNGRAPSSGRVGIGGFGDMLEEQAARIEGLRARMRFEEEKVERDMERQQVGMADRKMVELVRLASRAAGEGAVDRLVDEAIGELGAGLERVMKGGDCVRLKTLKGLLEVLTPLQGVEFLGAMSVVLLRMREKGLKRLNAGGVAVGGEIQ